MNDIISKLEAAQSYLQQCDHYDHKVIDGDVSLREFLAGMLNYNPSWIQFLYRIRWGLVRLLGMKQEGIPPQGKLQASDISFEVGENLGFFKVEDAKEQSYWIASASERHLTAYLVIAVEALATGENRFHVGTIVHYNDWSGPIYFNVIRPFHHLVVRAMMEAGIRSQNIERKRMSHA